MTRRSLLASLLSLPFLRRFRKPEVDFRIPIIVENRDAFIGGAYGGYHSTASPSEIRAMDDDLRGCGLYVPDRNT